MEVVNSYIWIRQIITYKRLNMKNSSVTLTFSIVGKVSDGILKYIWFLPENRHWHFMQIVYLGDDSLHEILKPIFWE